MLLKLLQLVLLLSALSIAQLPVVVGAGEVGGVTMEVDIDPCDGFDCPDGKDCRVIEDDLLLQLPVAHCIKNPSYQAPGPCVEYTVSTNVLSCKSEDQWRIVGVRQCSLRGEVDVSDLAQVEVRHACHTLHPQTGTRFFSASFTCCPDGYEVGGAAGEEEEEDGRDDKDPSVDATPPTTDTSTTDTPTTDTPTTDTPTTESPEGEPGFILVEEDWVTDETDEADEEDGDDEKEETHFFVIPLVLGTVAATALLVCIVVRRLRRQRRHTKSPTLTFIVNPSCEGLEGEGSGSGEGWDELQTGDTAPIVKNDFNSREQ